MVLGSGGGGQFSSKASENCRAQFFQFFNQPINFHKIHGTGFNVPVLDFFPNIVYQFTVHGTRLNVPVLDYSFLNFNQFFNHQPSSKYQLNLQRSSFSFSQLRQNNAHLFSQLSSCNPKVEQEDLNSSVSFGACVNYIFG